MKRALLLCHDDVIVGIVLCNNDVFERVWLLEDWSNDPDVPRNELGAFVDVTVVTHDIPEILDVYCQTIVESGEGSYIEIAPWSFKTWGLSDLIQD